MSYTVLHPVPARTLDDNISVLAAGTHVYVMIGEPGCRNGEIGVRVTPDAAPFFVAEKAFGANVAALPRSGLVVECVFCRQPMAPRRPTVFGCDGEGGCGGAALFVRVEPEEV